MIDVALRKKYADRKNTSRITSQLQRGSKEVVEEVQRQDAYISASFYKLAKAVALIYATITKIPPLPQVFKITGKVEVKGVPDVRVANLKELADTLTSIEDNLYKLTPRKFPTNFMVDNLGELKEYFASLEKRITLIATAISKIPPTKVEIPKAIDNTKEYKEMIKEIKVLQEVMHTLPAPKIELPKMTKIDQKEVVFAINSLKGELFSLKDAFSPQEQMDTRSITDALSKVEQAVNAVYNKPQMIPQPVTNISINALQGFAKSTTQTVGTTPVELPSYGQLFNRRSLIVFNGDSSNMLYIGGSDVTVNNGLPVLSQTYSPSIDAGYNMQIYGVAASSITARVFEVSKDQTANIQE